MPATPPFLLPANEVARLQALHQLDIQHSLRETVFTAFVRLMTQVFQLPISLISLVEEDEVHYIANEGLPGLRSQPRIEAICSLAVREGRAVVFADVAQAGPHLPEQAAAAAQQKQLRFYAGVPLCLPDARCIGTLCLIDHQSRLFSPPEQAVLEQFSDLIVHTLAVRHYCLTGAGLGPAHWERVEAKLQEELQALTAMVRYLTTRYGATVPVSSLLLDQVARRGRDVTALLADYQHPNS